MSGLSPTSNSFTFIYTSSKTRRIPVSCGARFCAKSGGSGSTNMASNRDRCPPHKTRCTIVDAGIYAACMSSVVFDGLYKANCGDVQSLERILYVWAIRHPASGYVQGINDLVTPFFQIFLSAYIGTLPLFTVHTLLLTFCKRFRT